MDDFVLFLRQIYVGLCFLRPDLELAGLLLFWS